MKHPMNRKLTILLLLLLCLTPLTQARADRVYESNMILVNKQWRLPSDYVPSDLSYVDIPFTADVMPIKKQMREEAARSMERMFAAARQDGIELIGVSGYRSYEIQNGIYWARRKQAGLEHVTRYVAEAGASEHQTVLAMYLVCPGYTDLTERFAETDAYAWLVENAHLYGYIIRYTPDGESETGYAFEPWHVRYLGSEAPAVWASGLTLEAYIADKLQKLDLSPALPVLYAREDG